MEGDDGAGLSIDVPGPLPELAPTLETPAPTPTPSRVARDLDCRRRLLWTEPFATLSTRTAAWGAAFNDGDVTMATASPGRDSPMADTRPAATERTEPGRITNAPALPAAPRYAGSTMKDRRVFMHAYDTYFHALSAFDTGFGQPFIMTWLYRGENMRDDLLVRVQKSPNQVSENEWIAYFLQAREPELEDYTTVDAAMKNLKMRLIFPDAAYRMRQLRTDMHRILDEYTMEQVMLEREQKVVKYFVAALEPADFREAIKKGLEYTQHKALKTDIVKCYAWILDQLKTYLVWQPPVVHAKPQARPQNKPGNLQRKQQLDGGSKHGATGETASPSSSEGKPCPTANKASPKFRNGGQPRRSCLRCGSLAHLVRECPDVTPDVTPDEVDQLLAARKTTLDSETNTGAERVKVVQLGGAGIVGVTSTGEPSAPVRSMVDDNGTAQATVDGYTLQTSLLDSGRQHPYAVWLMIMELPKQPSMDTLCKRRCSIVTDDSVVSGGIMRALESAGVTIQEYPVSRTLDPVGGHLISVARKVRFGEVEFDTSAGSLLLRNLDCLVHEEDRALSLTIGRPVMNRLGYTTDGLLAAARARQPEYELLEPEENTVDPSPLVRLQAMRTIALEVLDEDGDELDELVTSPSLAGKTTRAVQEALELKLQEATRNGLPSNESEQLRQLLFRYIDVFRLSFRNDPPVRVPPLRKERPVKAKARRYPPDHKRYLDEHIRELVEHGLVVENHRSRWASAARIVAKREAGQYRMTIDTHAINALTEPMPWPMPDIESDLAMVEDSDSYFTIDWWRGYWQLPLDEDSQELYTIMTHRGQILAWLDDILGYARSPGTLLVVLRKVLELCETFGLKLHLLKCCFFTREATWCGMMISAHGLVNLPAPRTAGELQQFLCAVNWMRGNTSEYNAITASLQYWSLQRPWHSVAQSRKKSRLHRVLLNSVGWTTEHDAALAHVKDALLKMVILAHPKEEWEVCLFADASQTLFGAVVTQIPSADVGLPVHEQRHQPLAFLSGSFVGNMSRWSTIDKEAFTIVFHASG
ncbi:LOW QUALITY PROTEIN: hypothetical protein PHMEG_00014979 [Phytophthora megakarya]|uniref:CCHC-type domain-containing protein n=1 Tax=Phytophthora megakarya TaxID=4795 RepID=A0A225W4Z3_9STRA|nr:LOW QUALITY PROTEIN: hypothetical protein PHMEG_00014979 [Phytophthora megakarya]